jgi:uncharacterized protein
MRENEREFQVFVKPAGPACNLKCEYCYYISKNSLYGDKKSVISDDLLEKYIISHFETSSEETVIFSWHGGEPLLAGIDFYRKAVKFQRKHKPAGIRVLNGIQTNGTLLTGDWCKFLSSEGFLVGLSMDGPLELHDKHRKKPGNSGSFAMVDKGFRLLRSHGILPEILCVVSSANMNYPIEVYHFFKNLGVRFISFLPLVEKSGGRVTDRSVDPLKFGIFLSRIFDEWIANDIGKISVQIFEEALRTAFNQDHTLCVFKKKCGGVPVLERNGNLYACDHYVDTDHLLGNINESSLSEMIGSEKQDAFGKLKAILPKYCSGCEVLQMCNGECPRNRFLASPDGEPGLNYLCAGYKYFFTHCKPFVEAVSSAWKQP